MTERARGQTMTRFMHQPSAQGVEMVAARLAARPS
jgi:hypothetical protein